MTVYDVFRRHKGVYDGFMTLSCHKQVYDCHKPNPGTNISSNSSSFSLPSIRLFIQKRRIAHLAIFEYANWWRTTNQTEKTYSRIRTKRFQSQNEHAIVVCSFCELLEEEELF